jgi:hypothetical protein
MRLVYRCRSVGASTAGAAGPCSRHPSSSATAGGRGHTACPRLPDSELPVSWQHTTLSDFATMPYLQEGGEGVAGAMLVGMCGMVSIVLHIASRPRAVQCLLLLEQQTSDV